MLRGQSGEIRSLNEAGRSGIQAVEETIALLADNRSRMESVSEMTMAHVRELSQTVHNEHEKLDQCADNLVVRIENVRVALEEPLREMSSAVREADNRHQQIESTLSRRIGDLNEASEKAAERAENIRNALRGQAQEISSLAGSVAGNAKTINEQMENKQMLCPHA